MSSFDRKVIAASKNAPQSLQTVMQAINKVFIQEIPKPNMKDIKMIKIQCKRLAGRTDVVGNTIFKFNKDGIATVPDVGRTRDDVDLICRKNGVSLVEDKVDDSDLLNVPTITPVMEVTPVIKEIDQEVLFKDESEPTPIQSESQEVSGLSEASSESGSEEGSEKSDESSKEEPKVSKKTKSTKSKLS